MPTERSRIVPSPAGPLDPAAAGETWVEWRRAIPTSEAAMTTDGWVCVDGNEARRGSRTASARSSPSGPDHAGLAHGLADTWSAAAGPNLWGQVRGRAAVWRGQRPGCCTGRC